MKAPAVLLIIMAALAMASPEIQNDICDYVRASCEAKAATAAYEGRVYSVEDCLKNGGC